MLLWKLRCSTHLLDAIQYRVLKEITSQTVSFLSLSSLYAMLACLQALSLYSCHLSLHQLLKWPIQTYDFKYSQSPEIPPLQLTAKSPS